VAVDSNHSIRNQAVKKKTEGRGMVRVAFALLFALLAAGCLDMVHPANTQQFESFNRNTPSVPIACDEQMTVNVAVGPYQVVPGDVVELTMPAILTIESADKVVSIEDTRSAPYRVTHEGMILLPVIGEIHVAGLTLEGIEKVVSEAYFAKYAKSRPPIFARMVEYKSFPVSITGAVTAPGIYRLRHDQMSLAFALMQAGGITEKGASLIRLFRAEMPGLAAHQPRSVPRTNNPAINLASVLDHLQNVDLHKTRPALLVDAPLRSGLSAWPALDDVRMSFRAIGANSTTGRLVIDQAGCTLVQEELDISSEWQRARVLGKLAGRLPVETVFGIDQHLGALSRILIEAHGFGNRSLQLLGDNFLGADIEPVRFQSPGNTLEYLDGISLGKRGIGENAVGALPSHSGDAVVVPSVQAAVLSVRGGNIPCMEVPLAEGDKIVVEPYVASLFTVLGLVTAPGNYEYPPGARYNLTQAIGFAGGLNLIADPRYAMVYRQKPDGSIGRACFRIDKPVNDKGLPDAMNVTIKPGDIIDVAHTPRTRTNLFLDKIISIQVGAYLPLIQNND